MSDVAFIGTCRVLDSAKHLKSVLNLPAMHTAHRVHSPAEIERLAGILSGEPIELSTLHTLSDAAFADLTSRDDHLHWTAEYLSNIVPFIKQCRGFVIEISTMKQSYVSLDGRKLYVNFYTARDLANHEETVKELGAKGIVTPINAADVKTEVSSTANTAATMARIKRLLGGRPILWVSHFMVQAHDQQTQRVNEVRGVLRGAVEKGAEKLGDSFYDPSDVIAELGMSRALQKGGQDVNHYSPEALVLVARRQWREAQAAITSAKAPLSAEPAT